jgi:hypothetical protein
MPPVFGSGALQIIDIQEIDAFFLKDAPDMVSKTAGPIRGTPVPYLEASVVGSVGLSPNAIEVF